MAFVSVLKKYNRSFWIANTIELFERWAWYGFFMLFANYLTGSADMGGLEFSQEQKGLIMGIGTGILYFLPVITGSIADKYGYKRVLFIAFVVYTSAFILLPHFNTFTGVFVMYLYLALGAALFKPIISATIAKTTNDETASIGFGIFYMMVNIGAFFGPLVTLIYKGQSELIFYISAGIVALNFILLIFYKEPDRVANTDSIWESIGKVFTNIVLVVKDFKFLLFLVIVAGFWTMYNQLFFTLPVFIAQWVDTSAVYNFFHQYLPFFSENYGIAETGQMEAEFITNFDAMFIIIFQIIVSTVVMKWRPLRSMMTGFLVCAIGMALTLATQNVLFTLVAIYVFAIGEMAGSPKITEYIGRIAPADKKALYMGYSFIPVFLGNVFAGIISGNVYGGMSDKNVFVKQEVAEKGIQLADGLTQNEYFTAAAQKMGMTPAELTNLLWDKYNPSQIWMVILVIGLAAVVALFLYDKFVMKGKRQ
ncbi:Dipeptide/tripeptide permease [Draconibacterium orientale]|nr:MFS transporter [Draconibacterium orientale]SES79326.1 Dipeptide/tripeptide permease [Draconibacterium orientale]